MYVWEYISRYICIPHLKSNKNQNLALALKLSRTFCFRFSSSIEFLYTSVRNIVYKNKVVLLTHSLIHSESSLLKVFAHSHLFCFTAAQHCQLYILCAKTFSILRTVSLSPLYPIPWFNGTNFNLKSETEKSSLIY